MSPPDLKFFPGLYREFTTGLVPSGSDNRAIFQSILEKNNEKKKGRKEKRETKNGREATAAELNVKSQKQDAKPKRTIKQVVTETLAAVEGQCPKSAFEDSPAAWCRS